MAFAKLLQDLPNALVGGEIDLLECRRGGECSWGGKVEANYIVGIRKPAYERFTNEATAASYYDNTVLFRHERNAMPGPMTYCGSG
jgi:hypothetical protein